MTRLVRELRQGLSRTIRRTGADRLLRRLPNAPGLLFRLDRLRQLIAATGGIGLNVSFFAAASLVAGLGSSWYFVGQGIGINTNRIGAWVEWPTAGQPDADPYTRARLVRHGILPISSRIAATFEARYDSEGQRLHSSCEYTIRSQPLKAGWWSIGVYDNGGLLIPNAADRYGFDSSTVITRPDGSFVIALAREARSGNWLPVGGAGRLTLVLTLLQPMRTDEQGGTSSRVSNDPSLDLPEIQRVYCR